MPKSRLSQAMNTVRMLVSLGGKKIERLTATMLAEKIRPLMVPAATVNLKMSSRRTKTIPARAN